MLETTRRRGDQMVEAAAGLGARDHRGSRDELERWGGSRRGGEARG